MRLFSRNKYRPPDIEFGDFEVLRVTHSSVPLETLAAGTSDPSAPEAISKLAKSGVNSTNQSNQRKFRNEGKSSGSKVYKATTGFFGSKKAKSRANGKKPKRGGFKGRQVRNGVFREDSGLEALRGGHLAEPVMVRDHLSSFERNDFANRASMNLGNSNVHMRLDRKEPSSSLLDGIDMESLFASSSKMKDVREQGETAGKVECVRPRSQELTLSEERDIGKVGSYQSERIRVLQEQEERHTRARLMRAVPELSVKLVDQYFSCRNGEIMGLNKLLLDEQGFELFEQYLLEEKNGANKKTDERFFAWERLHFFGDVDLFRLKCQIVKKPQKARHLALKFWFKYLFNFGPKFIGIRNDGIYDEIINIIFERNAELTEKEVFNKIGMLFDDLQEEVFEYLKCKMLPNFQEFFCERMDSLLNSETDEADVCLTQQAGVSNTLEAEEKASPMEEPYKFITDFIKFLNKEDFLKTEGIFRVNGDAKKAEYVVKFFKLKKNSENASSVEQVADRSAVLEKLSDLKVIGVYEACTAFKDLLKKSEAKLLSDDVQDRILDNFNDYRDTTKLQDKLREAFTIGVSEKDYEENQARLKYLDALLDFLRTLTKYKESNQMGASNLATCFVNTLFTKQEAGMEALVQLNQRIQLIKYLIDSNIEFSSQNDLHGCAQIKDQYETYGSEAL